jgi:hypothetical protein
MSFRAKSRKWGRPEFKVGKFKVDVLNLKKRVCADVISSEVEKVGASRV